MHRAYLATVSLALVASRPRPISRMIRCRQSERERHRCVVGMLIRSSPSTPSRSSSVLCRRRDVKGPMVEACTPRVLPVTQLQFYHNLHTLTNQPTYERLRHLENTRMTSVTTDGSDELMRSYGTSAMLLALGLALSRNWEQRKYRKWCVAS